MNDREPNIYVTGLYSGPNPSPGLGVARCLRRGLPKAKLIGVDYSTRSTGIHWDEFDSIHVHRSWAELDLPEYAQYIRGSISAGGIWISGLDLELYWLSENLRGLDGVLAPDPVALQQTKKPSIRAHEHLPTKVPEFISTDIPDCEIHSFCRTHGWRVWLKGPNYEAQRITNWVEFNYARDRMQSTWSTNELFLQADISGNEESVAFCAYEGSLLDCVHMSKLEVTPEGKTWAGKVSTVPENMSTALASVIKDLNWTGGGELEFVKQRNGDLWLIEWNPRFPAWIYGAALAGHNMPAALVCEALGQQMPEPKVSSDQFVRVVIEVPARSEFPVPPLSEPSVESLHRAGKHPSGMPQLSQRLQLGRFERRSPRQYDSGKPQLPASIIEDLANENLDQLQTPRSIFLNKTARLVAKSCDELSERLSSQDVKVSSAYSIKTNPDQRLMQLARTSGFMAEAISAGEVSLAMRCGFPSHDIILNGPGTKRAHFDPVSVYALFCDSPEELEHLVDAEESIRVSQVLGVRVRPPGTSSRFGIAVEEFDVFTRLATVIAKIPRHLDLGVHFHIASSAVGIPKWWNLFDSVVLWAQALELSGHRAVSCLDIGGGWFPEDLLANNNAGEQFADAIKRAKRLLPNLSHVILEPGKALSQPTFAVVSRILEVRRSGQDVSSLVTDCSIAEVNQVDQYPHRVLIQNSGNGAWEILSKGDSKILGRLCMENDILCRNVALPLNVREGGLIAICDAGAYDSSMAYAFGQGA